MSGRYALYQVLGLPPQASTEDVKKAYRKIAQRQHPDKSASADANGERYDEHTRRISNAYQILSDPIKKEEYDRLGDGFDDMEEAWDDDDFGEMAIPSFMFTAAPFITPFHPFSLVADPLKVFSEVKTDDKRGEEKRQIHGFLGSISDVEATLEDRITALKGLLEFCAKGASTFVIESVLDDEDALPTIIEDIQNEEEDETIKFLSTELLHVVATANYVDVYQTGGLPAVLSVLKTENTKVLHSALLSLQHITQLGSACAECFKCNVVQYCVHLMHKRSIDVLLTASHILHNLVVKHNDPHAALYDCRKLTAERYYCEIIRVVCDNHQRLETPSKVGKEKRKEAKASNSLSLQSQKVLTSVLAILAASDEAVHITLAEEDIRRLVDILSYKNVRDVVVNTCHVIHHLLSNGRMHLTRPSRLTESLVEQTLALARSENAPTAAVVLLTQLIHHRVIKPEEISRKDVARLLVAHLQSRSEETSVAAGRGLTSLCQPPPPPPPPVDGSPAPPQPAPTLPKPVAPHLETIIKQFLSVVQGTLDGTELRPASVMCQGLAAIASYDAGRRSLMKHPTLETLTQLVGKTGVDPTEKEAAAHAILQLSHAGKMINPSHPPHKDALKLLAPHLHSKNPRIQEMVILAFLTLARSGVKYDCVFGKSLEQLKTTRTNSDIAKALYKQLTAPPPDADKPDDKHSDELDPSAAVKRSKQAAAAGKSAGKDGKGGRAGGKNANGGAKKAYDTFSDASSTSSESTDPGTGGNNMFALLSGGKKKRGQPQPQPQPPQPQPVKTLTRAQKQAQARQEQAVQQEQAARDREKDGGHKEKGGDGGGHDTQGGGDGRRQKRNNAINNNNNTTTTNNNSNHSSSTHTSGKDSAATGNSHGKAKDHHHRDAHKDDGGHSSGRRGGDKHKGNGGGGAGEDNAPAHGGGGNKRRGGEHTHAHDATAAHARGGKAGANHSNSHINAGGGGGSSNAAHGASPRDDANAGGSNTRNDRRTKRGGQAGSTGGKNATAAGGDARGNVAAKQQPSSTDDHATPNASRRGGNAGGQQAAAGGKAARRNNNNSNHNNNNSGGGGGGGTNATAAPDAADDNTDARAGGKQRRGGANANAKAEAAAPVAADAQKQPQQQQQAKGKAAAKHTDGAAGGASVAAAAPAAGARGKDAGAAGAKKPSAKAAANGAEKAKATAAEKQQQQQQQQQPAGPRTWAQLAGSRGAPAAAPAAAAAAGKAAAAAENGPQAPKQQQPAKKDGGAAAAGASAKDGTARARAAAQPKAAAAAAPSQASPKAAGEEKEKDKTSAALPPPPPLAPVDPQAWRDALHVLPKHLVDTLAAQSSVNSVVGPPQDTPKEARAPAPTQQQQQQQTKPAAASPKQQQQPPPTTTPTAAATPKEQPRARAAAVAAAAKPAAAETKATSTTTEPTTAAPASSPQRANAMVDAQVPAPVPAAAPQQAVPAAPGAGRPAAQGSGGGSILLDAWTTSRSSNASTSTASAVGPVGGAFFAKQPGAAPGRDAADQPPELIALQQQYGQDSTAGDCSWGGFPQYAPPAPQRQQQQQHRAPQAAAPQPQLQPFSYNFLDIFQPQPADRQQEPRAQQPQGMGLPGLGGYQADPFGMYGGGRDPAENKPTGGPFGGILGGHKDPQVNLNMAPGAGRGGGRGQYRGFVGQAVGQKDVMNAGGSNNNNSNNNHNSSNNNPNPNGGGGNASSAGIFQPWQQTRFGSGLGQAAAASKGGAAPAAQQGGPPGSLFHRGQQQQQPSRSGAIGSGGYNTAPALPPGQQSPLYFASEMAAINAKTGGVGQQAHGQGGVRGAGMSQESLLGAAPGRPLAKQQLGSGFPGLMTQPAPAPQRGRQGSEGKQGVGVIGQMSGM